jgi:hypothetical protein
LCPSDVAGIGDLFSFMIDCLRWLQLLLGWLIVAFLDCDQPLATEGPLVPQMIRDLAAEPSVWSWLKSGRDCVVLSVDFLARSGGKFSQIAHQSTLKAIPLFHPVDLLLGLIDDIVDLRVPHLLPPLFVVLL